MDKDDRRNFLMDELERQTESGVSHHWNPSQQLGKGVNPYDPFKDPNVYTGPAGVRSPDPPIGHGTMTHDRGLPPNPPWMPTYRTRVGGIGFRKRTAPLPKIKSLSSRPRTGGTGFGICPLTQEESTYQKCKPCEHYDPKQLIEHCGLRRKESDKLSKK
nr:hypothetical protein 3 [bacterium]